MNDESINKIKVVFKNRHASLRELVQEVNISLMSIHNIMTDILDMKRVATQLVPKKLNFLQKRTWKQVAEDTISRISTDPTFMKSIITGDETWIYKYDIQTSQESSEWRLENELNSKKENSLKELKAIISLQKMYVGLGQTPA